MHFYWRIIEELKLLGETWTIQDPSLSRSYRNWVHRNQSAINLHPSGRAPVVSPLFQYKGLPHSLN